MKTKEQILFENYPNYAGNGLFINPNPNGVVATEKLNKASEVLRTTDFFKNFVKDEGFELSPADFKWEYIITFNKRSGFMVLRESGNDLRLFIYVEKDDLNWIEVQIKNFNPDNRSIEALGRLIKKSYRILK